MSLSETLKLHVNCHSEQPSAFWDGVVSHHCVTVNVTTSEGENIQPIDSLLAARFTGSVCKASPVQWPVHSKINSIYFYFFIREAKIFQTQH